MGTKFNWQKAYDDAVLEVDNSKLIEKANLAEEAIFSRLRTLSFDEHQERRAIQKAIMSLYILREEATRPPSLTAKNGRSPMPLSFTE
jgi:hypothetical protein